MRTWMRGFRIGRCAKRCSAAGGSAAGLASVFASKLGSAELLDTAIATCANNITG
jgi:hypothetical protein